jgi:CheY-like chemotaxis protein
MTKISAIYIIDDDPITVFGIKKMLGFVVQCDEITTYENGKLAIDQIKDTLANKKLLPEVIFLDINMPIMDGWQFLEEFISLNIPNKIRVNIVTSSIDAVDRDKWNWYKTKSHHTITFNNKPIKKEGISEITKVA